MQTYKMAKDLFKTQSALVSVMNFLHTDFFIPLLVLYIGLFIYLFDYVHDDTLLVK